MIFEEDLNVRNKAHCYYLMGLGNLGLNKMEEAKKALEASVELDYNHQNSRRFGTTMFDRIGYVL